jgi:hypothetical protein
LTIRSLDINTIVDEIADSFSLIFTRNDESKEIGRKLFADKGIPMVYEDDLTYGRWRFVIHPYSRTYPMLSDFEHYRGHLAVIQKDMKDWGPESFRDLLQPGYKDRFVWFATIFGLIIASVGVVGVIMSIIAVAIAIATLQATWKLVVLAEQ